MLISIHDVHLARQYVERIVALKSGVKVLDGACQALDLENVYNPAEPRRHVRAPFPSGVLAEAAR
jgi:ABC-type phosphate/phosphonate transport system ATPase subunit